MATRRSFIAGMIAAGLIPSPTWADAGSPSYLSAGKKPDGSYVLCGLTWDGEILFVLPLPERGHAAAAHPTRPEAVAFARRPGTYAVVLDCSFGHPKAWLEAPVGRHFYGHGAFSADGELLFTTENDFEAAVGVIGIWDVQNKYARIGEFFSGGTGPHDIKLMPDGRTLVVANGGIETHPDTGRAKLNLPTMRSNLSYISLDGALRNQWELTPEHQRNSIRHLAVSGNGDVAFAMQWQGDISDDRSLVGLHPRGGEELKLFEAASVRSLQGYVGSIAIKTGTTEIAITSPRSGTVQTFRETSLVGETSLIDVCGVAANQKGFLFTTGTGLVLSALAGKREHGISWDNHLIAI